MKSCLPVASYQWMALILRIANINPSSPMTQMAVSEKYGLSWAQSSLWMVWAEHSLSLWMEYWWSEHSLWMEYWWFEVLLPFSILVKACRVWCIMYMGGKVWINLLHLIGDGCLCYVYVTLMTMSARLSHLWQWETDFGEISCMHIVIIPGGENKRKWY